VHEADDDRAQRAGRRVDDPAPAALLHPAHALKLLDYMQVMSKSRVILFDQARRAVGERRHQGELFGNLKARPQCGH